MPSLMPGMPGTKEAYGISIIREDLRITIPPKAFERYELEYDTSVLLTTTHRGEGGFALIKKESAEATVFAKYVNQIEEPETIYWFTEKAYVVTKLRNERIGLTPEMLQAFHLTKGTKLMVVKSTTVAMSYTPIEIWKAKFAQRGLTEAIENMELLEEF
ncbi:MAG: hypothetical protein KKD28_05365 [Chloroflexi bacterium]|nr:hypothetical protein [Chloroflexota bacterium]